MNFFLTNQGTNLWVEITDLHHLASLAILETLDKKWKYQPPDFNNKAMIYSNHCANWKLQTTGMWNFMYMHAWASMYIEAYT